jgi:hypothetical protein
MAAALPWSMLTGDQGQPGDGTAVSASGLRVGSPHDGHFDPYGASPYGQSSRLSAKASPPPDSEHGA